MVNNSRCSEVKVGKVVCNGTGRKAYFRGQGLLSRGICQGTVVHVSQARQALENYRITEDFFFFSFNRKKTTKSLSNVESRKRETNSNLIPGEGS